MCLNSHVRILAIVSRVKFIFLQLAILLSFQAYSQLISIDTKDLSLILSVGSDSTLLFQHYGLKIGDKTPFLSKVIYKERASLYGTDPLAYLTAGGQSFGYPALRVTHYDGDINTELYFVDHNKRVLKDNNVEETRIRLVDRKYPFFVTLVYKAFIKENVITQQVILENKEKKQITLHNFHSLYLPIKSNKYYLNSFGGKWGKEMKLEQTLLTHGHKSIETRKGVRTTQTENPSFLLSLNTPMNENTGEVVAGALAWSGNYKINFELDEFDYLNITAGINPDGSTYHLKAREVFFTPEAIFTFSNAGAGKASRQLHDWARNYGVYDGQKIRPTLLNSWEGAYFRFNEEKLIEMIDASADMGLEMFVLDDGWFGSDFPRNGPNQGLGDWEVNRKKLPRGIGYLADYAVSKGIRFGIWIEPEMVNPLSNLAKQHPDWIVKTPGRNIPAIRDQYLLDLSNPKVQDFIFDVFDNTLKQSKNITYIKWDANRHVESPGSEYLQADQQSHFWVDYVRGLYKIYERIRQKYPDVLIQACASGGGRIDYGALKYQQEVWASDNTDPLCRAYIQYGINLIYPAMVTGAHVSAAINHQTRNQTPIKFRFDVAMSGRLGLELQPKQMTDDEKTFSKRAISEYKNIRNLVMFGDLYRIVSPYENLGFYSLMYVSKTKQSAVFFAYLIDYQNRMSTPNFKLNGLDPNKKYLLKELNNDNPKFWGEGKVFSGEFLMNQGINLKFEKLFDSIVFSIQETF